MKNKEIEKLLNKIRNSIKTHRKLNLDDDMLVVLEFDVIQWNLLLSYIEQLENNRDKAIEQCNDWIKFYKKLNSDERLILRLEEISRTLKGDSDE